MKACAIKVEKFKALFHELSKSTFCYFFVKVHQILIIYSSNLGSSFKVVVLKLNQMTILNATFILISSQFKFYFSVMCNKNKKKWKTIIKKFFYELSNRFLLCSEEFHQN